LLCEFVGISLWREQVYGYLGWGNRQRMVPPVATEDLMVLWNMFNCFPLAVPSDSHYRYHDDENHLYPLRDDDLVYAYMRICGI